MGGLGIFVAGGTVTLDRDGDPSTTGQGEDAGLAVNLNVGDDHRFYFREGLGALTSSVTVTLDGALTVDLPLFFPTVDFPLGGSSQDNDHDGNPDNNLHITIDCLDDLLAAINVSGAPRLSADCLQLSSST